MKGIESVIHVPSVDPPAYYYGSVVVDYILRRYGADKFFQLYSTCRKDTFAADLRRILGIGLDELEAELWENVDGRFHEQIDAVDPSAWSLLDLPDPGPIDEAAHEAFLAHYPEAAEKLRDAYTHVRITAESVSVLHAADGSEARPPSVVELQMARNGDSAKVVRASEEVTVGRVANANALFRVERMPHDDGFRISGFGPASPVGRRAALRQIRQDDRFLHAAYSISYWSVLEWIAEPHFTIIGVVRSEQDDKELLTVHFRSPVLDRDGRPCFRAGWFSVRPDDGWVIEEYELRAGPFEGLRSVSHVRAEYGAEQDGVPALHRVKADWRYDDGQTRQTTTKVKTLEFGPVPDLEFELAAFGLEPPEEEVHRKSVWHRILHATGWALTAVVLTLVLTVALHFAAGRPIIRRRQHDVPLANDAERSPR